MVGRAPRWCAGAVLTAAILAGCDTQHLAPAHTPRASTSSTPEPATRRPSPTPSPSGPPPALHTATPGDFGSTAESLRFTWATGFAPPQWLPSFIAKAPPAPTTGSVVCGVDVRSGLYTALIRYDPASQAGAITLQIQAFQGAGAYTNSSAGITPVDVEVSPPSPSLSGLSGFGVAGASVTVDQDLKSGTVQSTLQSGARIAGSITGNWRCG